MQKYLLTMRCLQGGQLRGFGGTELHGLLFQLLHEAEPALATAWHESRDKPFALTTLEPAQRQGGFTLVQPDQTYIFGLHCLNDDLPVAKLSWKGRIIQLGSAELIGLEMVPQLACSYDHLFRSVTPYRQLRLEFVTPTSFRQRGLQLLFPEPERVFGSLAQRWNAHSPVKLPEDTDYSFPRISRYNLRTELVDFGRYKIIGFVGWCAYDLPRTVPDFLAHRVQVLARYAELAGVGYKPTMGLGQVRIMGSERR